MEDAQERFDPTKYMTRIGNADYLEVRWRLLWLRDVHPDAIIRTEMVSDKMYNETLANGNARSVKEAVFRCTIILPSGAEAVGHGSETSTDFGDYREKAETKAVGRACATLGFGTAASGNEYAGEAQAGRVVDSPVRQMGTVAATVGQPVPLRSGGQGDAQGPVQGATARYPNQGAQTAGIAPQSNQGQVNAQRGNGGGVMGDPNKPATQNQIKYVTDLLRGMNVDPDAFDWSGLTNGEASGYITELRSGNLPQDVAAALQQLTQG